MFHCTGPTLWPCICYRSEKCNFCSLIYLWLAVIATIISYNSTQCPFSCRTFHFHFVSSIFFLNWSQNFLRWSISIFIIFHCFDNLSQPSRLSENKWFVISLISICPYSCLNSWVVSLGIWLTSKIEKASSIVSVLEGKRSSRFELMIST